MNMNAAEIEASLNLHHSAIQLFTHTHTQTPMQMPYVSVCAYRDMQMATGHLAYTYVSKTLLVIH